MVCPAAESKRHIVSDQGPPRGLASPLLLDPDEGTRPSFDDNSSKLIDGLITKRETEAFFITPTLLRFSDELFSLPGALQVRRIDALYTSQSSTWSGEYL